MEKLYERMLSEPMREIYHAVCAQKKLTDAEKPLAALYAIFCVIALTHSDDYLSDPDTLLKFGKRALEYGISLGVAEEGGLLL